MDVKSVRRLIIECAVKAGTGHIGSALSVANIITVLYDSILKFTGPDDPDRDRFILSKGHAALALYVVLYLKGILSDQHLAQYCQDNTLVGVHPDHRLEGIDFSTGSLGQGLSFGAGAALAALIQNSNRRVYVLISDAEANEGAVWEAVMFAAHHKLANLTVIMDANGQQAMGYTREILDLAPHGPRWHAFGWHVQEIDGHDDHALHQGFKKAQTCAMPSLIIAQTVSGKGVGFMEGKIKWHYWSLNPDEYQQALQDVGRP